jgi:hypothetical protein
VVRIIISQIGRMTIFQISVFHENKTLADQLEIFIPLTHLNNNLLSLLFIVLHIYSVFKVSIVIKLILLRIWFNVLIDMALLPFSALVRLIVTEKDSLYILVLIVYTFFQSSACIMYVYEISTQSAQRR